MCFIRSAPVYWALLSGSFLLVRKSNVPIIPSLSPAGKCYRNLTKFLYDVSEGNFCFVDPVIFFMNCRSIIVEFVRQQLKVFIRV